MLEFIKKNGKVILEYSPEFVELKEIYDELSKRESFIVSKTFHVTQNELISSLDNNDDQQSIDFVVAEKLGDYYKFPADILGLNNDVYIHQDIEISRKFFIAARKISIFRKIDKTVNSDIYVGGKNEGSIPIAEFRRLINNFPNSYELDKYVSARVESIISSYTNSNGHHEKKYHDYLNKKISLTGEKISNQLADYETFKYKKILSKLKKMLLKEEAYSETQWQEEILDILLLLYPKYLYVFREAPVKDFYNGKNRSIDYILIDSSGNIDIVEIKKPFNKCIVTSGLYRDNYIPLRDLTGTVMQIEKYIFHLSKSGSHGERKIMQKYKDKTPSDMEIKITNPGGFIIMGRKNNLSKVQLQDFEIIKRKYKNLIDILTYDDLIERLEFIIGKWAIK